MKKMLGGFGLILLAGCVVAAYAAENIYVPLLRLQADNTVDLYWMKLDLNGKLVKGPRLIRNSAGSIWSAAILPQGNKMLFNEEPLPTGPGQIYSVGVNPKSGKVTNGPVALTTGSSYRYYALSMSKDGRKFVYDRMNSTARNGNWDIFLRKFKKNGALQPNTIPIATSGTLSESESFITEDGRSVYYDAYVALGRTIFMQPLSANGVPSGAPVTALSLPGENVYLPKLDSGRTWMSYWRYSDGNLYVTRVSTTGQATGTPVKITSVGPGLWAFGGITRNPRILIYTLPASTLEDAGVTTYTVYSQKLDANGNPEGAPTVLVPASPYWSVAWIVSG